MLHTRSAVIWLVAFLAILAVVPTRADQEPSKADSDALQGTWELLDEKPQGKNGSTKWTLEVKGNEFAFRNGEKVTRQVIATLYATKHPKLIDLKEDGEDKPFLAIYKLEKDRLTLCISVEQVRPTNTRPTEFEAKSGQVLATYIRVKR